MTNTNEQNKGDSATSLEEWNPHASLTVISPEEVEWSNGFLRSRPEKWCVGFSEPWMSLYSSFSVDMRVGEVKPFLGSPQSDSTCFRATVDEQPLWLAFDTPTVDFLLSEVHPRTFSKIGGQIFVEYIAQRFLVFLIRHQTIVDNAECRFFGKSLPSDCAAAGGIRLNFSVNGTNCSLSLFVSSTFVSRMDGLWRRQIHSSLKGGSGVQSNDGEVRVEVAQLAVPPHILPEYLRKGAIIDLERNVSDAVLLRVGHQPFAAATLMRSGERFVCKIAPGLPPGELLQDGTTRVSIECGRAIVEQYQLQELRQVGATLSLSSEVTNRMNLCVNREKVGEADLCVMGSRFALRVV
jgi:flagellar motor switch/type III secretory pathway protein FliN